MPILTARSPLPTPCIVMQYRAGFRELDQYQLLCADTNADGSVNIADAMHIMQFRADPYGTAGILCKPLHDPRFHEGTIDPPVGP